MRNSITKSARKTSPRLAAAKRSATPASKGKTSVQKAAAKRATADKSVKDKPVKAKAATPKVVTKKAVSVKSVAKPEKTGGKRISKSASKSKAAPKAAPRVKAATKSVSKTSKPTPKPIVKTSKTATSSRTVSKTSANKTPAKAASKSVSRHAPAPTKSAAASHATNASITRKPTRDDAAALQAFERARKEFARGNFAEARNLFRTLVEKFSGVVEVTARARTYLTVTETRLRTEKAQPKDSEGLYDRGVMELNRGDYTAAQDFFERALRRDADSPAAAYSHYGLAAARARQGNVESALAALEKALRLQPSLRVRAQQDADLSALRTEPAFETLLNSLRA